MAKLDPKLKSAVEAAYELGVQDGEGRQCRKCKSKFVALLMDTNVNLWEGLNDLDDEYPKMGIVLSFDEARSVINCLNAGKKNTHLAGILKYRVQTSSKDLPNLYEMLKTCFPEKFKKAMESSKARRKRKK